MNPHDDPLNEHNVRPDWKANIGKPGKGGVWLSLMVATSGDVKDANHEVEGIVGVPSPHRGDGELFCLAAKLLEATDTPALARYTVDRWKAVEGSYGVEVKRHAKIPVWNLDSDDVISFEVSTPPKLDAEITDKIRSGMEHSRQWGMEYERRPYLRFEDRKQLTERSDDVNRNTLALSTSGKITYSSDEIWQRFGLDVIIESHKRGYPLHRMHQRHPDFPYEQRFWDDDVCREAADLLKGRTLQRGFVVKYGKKRHMRALYERGEVLVGSATDFDSDRHNQAIRDQERKIAVRGAMVHAVENRPMTPKDGDAPYRFFPIRQAMDKAIEFGWTLTKAHYATLAVESQRDFRMFCWSTELIPALFSDFEADACVVFNLGFFAQRLAAAMRHYMPSSKCEAGRVRYIDPLGVYGHDDGPFDHRGVNLRFTKSYGFAYQREGRMAWASEHAETLEPVVIEVGPLKGRAQLIELG